MDHFYGTFKVLLCVFQLTYIIAWKRVVNTEFRVSLFCAPHNEVIVLNLYKGLNNRIYD